jgi:hypothetical protein
MYTLRLNNEMKNPLFNHAKLGPHGPLLHITWMK